MGVNLQMVILVVAHQLEVILEGAVHYNLYKMFCIQLNMKTIKDIGVQLEERKD